MNRAIAVLVRGRADLSFITRLDIPTGSLANLAAFLKYINLLRTGNVSLQHDSLNNIEMLIRDIKAMITQDNKAAANSLEELGVTKHSHLVAHPKSGQW